jgi:molybdate transport system ATP-binding protein
LSGLDVQLQWSPPGSGSFRVDVALELGAECSVLFGRSGAGKSSILRLIAGLERPEAGRVRLGEEVLFDSSKRVNLPLRSRRVGMIFQDDLLFPHRSVAGNVAFGLRGWHHSEASRRVDEVAALCGVEHLLGRRPSTLSGGERQRVGLARALAPRPRLLLCDEPVSALDLPARDDLIEGLRAVRRAEGIPLLYVTHNPAEAVALGSLLFLLEAGRVVDKGPPLDVLARAKGIPLEGLMNRFEAIVESQPDVPGESVLRLAGGPALVVPRLERPVGAATLVRIRADDILLARGPVAGLSARNILEGRVVRLVEHWAEAEVFIRTGEVDWIVSVVTPAVRALGLCADVPVHMIVKARSCHVTDWEKRLSTDDTDGHR